ncbi:MAG: glycoside hydrolase family 16 protein, partial [Pseudomonadales bacterium]
MGFSSKTRKKYLAYLSVCSISIGLVSCGGGGGSSGSADSGVTVPAPIEPPPVIEEPVEPATGWELVWNDEFDGNSLNGSKWNIQLGDGSDYGIPGWGNNELQWYQAENIAVEDGKLLITARQESTNGYPYSSGRLRTSGKYDTRYGRIEASIQVPAGVGLWSAFWMLPTDSQYGGWASGGEIDIMEVINAGTTNEVLGTVHYGMAWPLNQQAGRSHPVFAEDGFHTYAIEWEQDEIRWYLDDIHYHTVSSATWWSYFYGGPSIGYTSNTLAPFDQDFHLLLNLAVGGNLPGAVGSATVFPSALAVDYVRIYKCDSGNQDGTGCR